MLFRMPPARRLSALLLSCAVLFACLAGPHATSSFARVDALTQRERDFAVKYLQETRQKFLESIAGLSEAQWKYKPAADRWSVAEVSEHIALSETAILQLVTERVMKAPASQPAPGAPTDEAVIKLITDRSSKAQAPEVLKPTGKWASREELTKDFAASRDKTVAYVKETGEDLRGHSAPHPALKTIDAYQ